MVTCIGVMMSHFVVMTSFTDLRHENISQLAPALSFILILTFVLQ